MINKSFLGRVAIRLLLPVLVCWAGVAGAATTAGGVAWLDSLKYSKPAFVPLTVPDEASVSNKYYVDFSSGSGSVCSQSAPCADLANVAGKAGTNGGPAYIYLKGSGRLRLTGNLYGSNGQEVVIKPWPGATQVVTMTNDGSGTVGGANIVSGSGVHHVILDGGPDVLFDFTSVPNSGQNGYVLVVSSNDITVARSRIRQARGSGPIVGHAAGGGTWSRIRYVNNEIYDNTANLSGAAYAFYLGGGAGCNPPSPTTGFDDLVIQNNVIRNIAGNAIMGEPRALTANRSVISGNAFHTIGNGQNRAAIGLTNACGGSFNTINIYNNTFFDLWQGAISIATSFPSTTIYNNTIYDFAKTPNAILECHGITSGSEGDRLTVKNNIVLKSNNGQCNYVNRNSGWTASNNLCAGGCDLSASPALVFKSTDSSSADFLRPLASSPTVKSGTNVFTGGVTLDYLGLPRISSGAFDIGALGFGVSVVPQAPTGVQIQ